jgi:hypothetical protein
LWKNERKENERKENERKENERKETKKLHKLLGKFRKHQRIIKDFNDVCSICLSSFGGDIKNAVELHSCNHVYHCYCICRWLIHKDTCRCVFRK